MSAWHRRLIAETRALQGLSPTIADDPVGIELAARFLTSAAAFDALPPPATDRASGATGAVRQPDDEPGRALVGKSRPRAASTAPTPTAEGAAHG